MAHAAEVPNFPDHDNGNENDKETVSALQDRTASLQGFPLSAGTSPVAIDTLREEEIYAEITDFEASPLDPFFARISAAVDACAPYVQASAETARTFGRKIKTLKEEKPLQFLTVIAGSAFALGMVIRLRRSRS